MIRVRTWFSGWVEVTEDQARAWILHRWRKGYTARGWTRGSKLEDLRGRVEGIDVDRVVDDLMASGRMGPW